MTDNSTLDCILNVLHKIERHLSKESGTATSFGSILNNAVSMHVDESGKYDGVLVKTLDRAFVISLKNRFEGRVTSSMLYDVPNGWRLPSISEALLILLYRKEINSLLSRFGSPIDEDSNGEYFWIEKSGAKNGYMQLSKLSSCSYTSDKSAEGNVRLVKNLDNSETSKKASGDFNFC